MSDTPVDRYLTHLRVERRVSAHTLAAYGEALARLAKLAGDAGLALERVQSAHVRRFAAQLHGGGLGPRSIALTLSGWRRTRSRACARRRPPSPCPRRSPSTRP